MDLTPFAGSEDEEAKACDLRTNPLLGGGDDGGRSAQAQDTRRLGLCYWWQRNIPIHVKICHKPSVEYNLFSCQSRIEILLVIFLNCN